MDQSPGQDRAVRLGRPRLIGHIIGDVFKAELGFNMEHIGYRGAAPMFQDMTAGSSTSRW